MRSWGLVPALGVPVAIDAFSCVLALRRNRGGSGSSGLPMMTLVLYAIAIITLFSHDLLLCVALLLGAAVFHVLVVIWIPMWDLRRLQRAPKGEP